MRGEQETPAGNCIQFLGIPASASYLVCDRISKTEKLTGGRITVRSAAPFHGRGSAMPFHCLGNEQSNGAFPPYSSLAKKIILNPHCNCKVLFNTEILHSSMTSLALAAVIKHKSLLD